MNEPGNLRTAVRVTIVVGAGLTLAPLLILLDGGVGNEPPMFLIGARAQVVFGTFVFLIGVALWQRRRWARSAALFLLRLGAVASVGWSIYGAFEIGKMASGRGILALMILLITAFWLVTFSRGIAYLNQASVVAEMENGAQ